jgi:tetratricopeptide (TPR) repeat protein
MTTTEPVARLKKILMVIVFLVLIGTSRIAVANQSDFLDPNLEVNDSFEYFQDLENKIKRSLQKDPNSWKLYWRLARAQFYHGNRSVNEEEQKSLYTLCIQNAERSIELNSESVGGNYFNAVCSGKMGQLNGIWSSFSMISEFREQMQRTVQLDPNFEFGGPHRALGKLFHDLPFFLGGDLKQSIEHLKLAVKLGPEYSDNYYYLAESLFDAEEYKSAESALSVYLEKSHNEKDANQKRERAENFLQQIKMILHH